MYDIIGYQFVMKNSAKTEKFLSGVKCEAELMFQVFVSKHFLKFVVTGHHLS